jgi:small-conductance mechanosensitive channel
MEKQELQNYILEQITELDKNRDEQEYVLRGKFSFGLIRQKYEGLPSWHKFLGARKKLIRLIWLQAFLLMLSVSVMYYSSDVAAIQSWWKAAIVLVATSAVMTVFYGIMFFFSIAFEVNKVNKHVRKLIYEDLLRQLGQMKEEKAVQ